MARYKQLSDEELRVVCLQVFSILAEEYELKFFDKGRPDSEFYASYPDLFTDFKKKRAPKYQRKRIFIASLTPKAQVVKALDKVCPKIQAENPKYSLPFLPGQFEIKTVADLKGFDLDALRTPKEYSDVILFIKGKKQGQTALFKMRETIENNRFLFPNLVVKENATPGEKTLKDALESTMYFAYRTNEDVYSKLWKKYAFLDRLQELVNEQITRYSRTLSESEMAEKLKQYGIVHVHPTSLPEFMGGEKILVFGDSMIGSGDMIDIIRAHGMDPDRFDFSLEYKDNIDFDQFRYSRKYSELMIGPKPHSVRGTQGFSSGIALIDANPGIYPHKIELKDYSGDFKITRESFTKGLEQTYAYLRRHPSPVEA